LVTKIQTSRPTGAFSVSSDDEHNGKHFIRILDLEHGTSTRLTNGGDENYPLCPAMASGLRTALEA
jgi:hypothetical protein